MPLPRSFNAFGDCARACALSALGEFARACAGACAGEFAGACARTSALNALGNDISWEFALTSALSAFIAFGDVAPWALGKVGRFIFRDVALVSCAALAVFGLAFGLAALAAFGLAA